MIGSHSTPKRRRLAGLAIAASLAALAGGTLVFAHAGGGQHHGGLMAAHSSEHHLEHMQALLTKIGATAAQKSQISGLLEPAFKEMAATHEAHSATLKQFHEGLLAPSIDRARLESLRVEQVKSLDEATKRMVTAMTDAAEVLSPEQRAALAQEIAKHHGG